MAKRLRPHSPYAAVTANYIGFSCLSLTSSAGQAKTNTACCNYSFYRDSSVLTSLLVNIISASTLARPIYLIRSQGRLTSQRRVIKADVLLTDQRLVGSGNLQSMGEGRFWSLFSRTPIPRMFDFNHNII